MKLAYVHNGYWPSSSPSSTFVTYNALALCTRFDEVHLFIKRGGRQESEDVLEKYFARQKPANLVIHDLKTPRKAPNAWYYLRVCLALRRLRPDGLISRSITFLPYLARYKRKFGLPVWYETHDFFMDLSLRDDRIDSVKRRNHRLETKYLPRLSGLVCLQEAQKALYRRYLPALPIHVCRTGAPTPVRHDGDRRYLCYTGSLDAHKGIEGLIHALSLTQARPPLLIIGGKTEDEKDGVRRLAERYAYPDVTVTGWVNKQRMDELLRQARWGVVPLAPTFFNRFLTSPLKIFDYYAYGVPVFAADLPTTRELIDDNITGAFYPSGDDAALAARIDALFAATGYEERVEAVYRKAESLRWEKRAEVIEDMIRSELRN